MYIWYLLNALIRVFFSRRKTQSLGWHLKHEDLKGVVGHRLACALSAWGGNVSATPSCCENQFFRASSSKSKECGFIKRYLISSRNFCLWEWLLVIALGKEHLQGLSQGEDQLFYWRHTGWLLWSQIVERTKGWGWVRCLEGVPRRPGWENHASPWTLGGRHWAGPGGRRFVLLSKLILFIWMDPAMGIIITITIF